MRVRQSTQAPSKAYACEYALMPAFSREPVWKYYLSSKNTTEISGLTSGAAYLFRMSAWNGTSDTVFSPTGSRYLQIGHPRA